jgi:hypothetical protein
MEPPDIPESDEPSFKGTSSAADWAIGAANLQRRIDEARALDPSTVDPKSDDGLYRYFAALDDGANQTHARMLIADGIALTPPDAMDDKALHAKLWEVIRGLATRRTYLSSTDHLSDRELYEHLWTTTLNEWTDAIDATMGACACHIDLLGSEKVNFLHPKYEAGHEDWALRSPENPVSEHVDPPYDRDRHLPQRSECPLP